jgi:hypothetical protein
MNRGRFIGGAICVAVAVVLAVLTVVLPDEDMWFQVGDQNIPFLPSIILGIVGAALLLTSRGGSASDTGVVQTPASGVSGSGSGAVVHDAQSQAGTVVAPPGGAESAAGPSDEVPPPDASDKAQLNKALERMGWGAFLIMLGGFALVPDDVAPKGLWSIGLGVIWLGLNAARYNKGIRMSGFTTFLGLVCLVSGLLELIGLEEVGGAIFLIALGTFVIARPWIERRDLFGKAEES